MSSRMSIIQSEIKVLIMGNTVFFIIYIIYNVLYNIMGRFIKTEFRFSTNCPAVMLHFFGLSLLAKIQFASTMQSQFPKRYHIPQ